MSASPTVFSVAALDALFLEGASSIDGDTSIFTVAKDVRERVTKVDIDGISFFVHASDGADARRIVLPRGATVEELEASRSFAQTSLQRAHQMALIADAFRFVSILAGARISTTIWLHSSLFRARRARSAGWRK